MVGSTVVVKGAKELKASFRKIEDAAARKGMQAELKSEYKRAADVVAQAGKSEAPSRTGKLAGSIVPVGVLAGARVRAKAPYGWYVHQGRGPGKKGGPMRPNPFLRRAAEAKAGEVRDILAAGLSKFVGRVVR